MTDQFLALGKMRADADEIPDLPMAVFPHPLGGLSVPEVQAKADGVLPAAAAGLIQG